MKIVIASGVAVVVPEGCSDWDAACWINPGLLPDEYAVYDAVFLSANELRQVEEEE